MESPKKTETDKSSYDRLSLTLPDHLNDWLYQFTVEIKRNGGYRVPKTLVLRAFIRAVKESGIQIDLKNIRNIERRTIADRASSDFVEDLLTDRIIQAIQKG